MSVSEQSDLRPPRLTPHLALPIPGDAGPADYVTDTGAIADRVDLTLGRPVVTSLPSDPIDGQEIYYVADATLPTLWHARYHAATRVWHVLGGPPITSFAGPTGVATLNEWIPGAPELTLPEPGIYEFAFAAKIGPNAAAGTVGASVWIGGNDPNMEIVLTLPANTNGQITSPSLGRPVGPAGGLTISMAYFVSVFMDFDHRWLIVRPITLGIPDIAGRLPA
jgi:hypothetical protein